MPKSWIVLQKRNPARVKDFVHRFTDLVDNCERRGIVSMSPDLLTPLQDIEFAHHLAEYSERYLLDSTDAELLMEAARFGVRDILTLDRDYRRATADFTIYGWPDYDPARQATGT